MPSQEMIIINRLGLHARAAAKLVKLCSGFNADIELEKKAKGQRVNGKSIMGVMLLSASQGTEMLFHAEGEDAEEALKAIQSLLENYFDEGE